MMIYQYGRQQQTVENKNKRIRSLHKKANISKDTTGKNL
jgi:hypothetical protein